MKRLPALVFALAALFAGSAFADDAGGRTPLPAIPKAAEGQQCIRDNAFMRRYHMVMLLQQRDQTMHEGLREGDFSIKKCVTCHVVRGADGKAVSYTDPKHFCRSCHDYEAVSIDCFECHASKPAEGVKGAQASRVDNADVAALGAYLDEATR